MTQKLTEVRRYFHCDTQPWIVDILGRVINGYGQPDGTAGKVYRYDSKDEAEKAAALYEAKNTSEPSAGESKTKLDCLACGVNGSMGVVKETNPKDIIGMKNAPMSTLSCAVLYEMGLGMLEGARKYGRHNYRVMGCSATVYYDAAMGHLMDWFEGEDVDPDSGMNHVTKAMTALATLRDSMLMENWLDDRPLRNPNKLYKKSFNPKAKEIIEKYPDCVVPYLENNKDLDRGK